MRVPQAWRDVRGKTLENELSDLVTRINRMNTRAKSRCLDNIWATHAPLKEAYDSKSIFGRKAFLQRLTAPLSLITPARAMQRSNGFPLS
jgi:hypothetical protein